MSSLSLCLQVFETLFVLRMSNATVQYNSLHTLSKLNEEDSTRALLSDLGTGKVIIDAMSHHAKDPKILKASCVILKSLDVNLYSLNRLGAGARIKQCMHDFPGDVDLQKQACKVIRQLAKFIPNSIQFVDEGFSKLIATSIQRHMNDAELVEIACATLWCFGRHPGNSEKLWNIEVINPVLKAMWRHPYSAGVQEKACGFISTLTHLYSLMRLGVSQVVIQALENHTTNESIVICGLFILKNLGRLKSNSKYLLDYAGAETIVGCMQAHQTVLAVQRDGCHVLRNLTYHDANKLQLAEAGIGQFMLDLLKDFKHDHQTFCEALVVLADLASCVKCAAMLVQMKAARYILAGLVKHSNVENVIMNSFYCLDALYYWDKPGLCKLGIERIVSAALTRFPDNSTIQRKGNKLLSIIQHG